MDEWLKKRGGNPAPRAVFLLGKGKFTKTTRRNIGEKIRRNKKSARNKRETGCVAEERVRTRRVPWPFPKMLMLKPRGEKGK